ncbi:MAG TPA: SNF2-related protein, partial [Planctomycetota bacterium]|nr:SNF2-related protein [Planctomycetota bacterium]
MPVRPEDFPFPFPPAQRSLGERFVAERQVELLEHGPGDAARVRVKVFKRTVEAWVDRKDGKLRFECECPYVENEGAGCAHLYALCLAVAAADAPEPEKSDDDAPLDVRWIVDRARSNGRRGLFLGPWTPDAAGALQPLKATASVLVRADGDDDRLFKILTPAAGGRAPLDRGGGLVKADGPWLLEDDALDQALPLLLKSGRFHHDESAESLAAPIRDDSRFGPYEFVLRIARKRPGDAGSPYAVEGVFVRGGETLRAQEVDLVCTARRPFLLHRGRFAWLDAFDAFDWLRYFLKKDGPEVPAGDLDGFLERLAAGGALPRLWPPDAAAPLPVAQESPTPVARITREAGDLVARIEHRYAGVAATAVGRDALMYDPAAGRQLRRDLAAEEESSRRLILAGATEDPDAFGRFVLTSAPLDVFASRLLADGWEVLVDGRAQRRAGASRIRLATGVDWFELRGGLDFDGEVVPLAAVFDAVKKGKRFVALKGGAEGLIPDGFAEKWSLVDELAERRDGALRLRRTQGLVLDALLAERASELEAQPADLDAMRASLELLRRPPDVAPPATLKADLRPYQKTGFSWLCALDAAGFGGCLADDMGLGKTVQALAFLEARRQAGAGTSLVVVPRSLLHNWKVEAERFAPRLRVLEHWGTDRARDVRAFKDVDLVLTTYGTLRADAPFLKDRTFDCVILDEAQSIKNAQSATAKAARLLKGEQRLALSGTPIENHLGELWSLMEFLNPGLLGSASLFRGALEAGTGV